MGYIVERIDIVQENELDSWVSVQEVNFMVNRTESELGLRIVSKLRGGSIE